MNSNSFVVNDLLEGMDKNDKLVFYHVHLLMVSGAEILTQLSEVKGKYLLMNPFIIDEVDANRNVLLHPYSIFSDDSFVVVEKTSVESLNIMNDYAKSVYADVLGVETITASSPMVKEEEPPSIPSGCFFIDSPDKSQH